MHKHISQTGKTLPYILEQLGHSFFLPPYLATQTQAFLPLNNTYSSCDHSAGALSLAYCALEERPV